MNGSEQEFMDEPQSHISATQNIRALTSVPRTDRRDLILLVGAAVVALLVAGLLLSDFSLFDQSMRAKGDPIATLSNASNIVKHRPAALPVWDNARSKQALYERDQIFTDARSSASISFDDKTQIDLAENALVIIERMDQSSSINLQKGSFIVRSSPNKANINIKVGGVTTKLLGKDAVAMIRKDDSGKTSIDVLSGRAEVESKGKTVNLDSSTKTEIKADGVVKKIERLRVELVEPQQAERFGLERAKQINFAWKLTKGSSNKFVWELSPTTGFESSETFRVETANLKHVQALNNAGTYYWRAGAWNLQTSSYDFSAPRPLVIEDRSAPQLIHPEMNQTLSYEVQSKDDLKKGREMGVRTYFDWTALKKSSDDVSNVLEVARDHTFKDMVWKSVANNQPVESPLLGAGNYYWRVRRVFGKAASSPWSKTGVFQVEEIGLPGSVRLLDPAPNATVFVKELLPKISFQWERATGARDYEFEIALDGSFQDRSKTFSTVVKDNSRYELTPKKMGSYAWRVKAVDPLGRNIEPTKARKLTILSAPPQDLEPIDGSSISAQERLVPLSWSKRVVAKAYKVQIARKPDFEELLLDQAVRDNNYAWKAQEAGQYFWRVLMQTDPKFSNPEPVLISNIQSFTIARDAVADAPRLILPENLTQVATPAEKTIIKFSWASAKPYAMYEFELATDETFQKMAQQKTIKDTKADLSLKKGNYFWRVRALNRDKKPGLYSEVFQLQITSKLDRPLLSAKQTLIPTYGRTAMVDLKWTKLNGAQKYRLEVSSDQLFRTGVRTFERRNLDLSSELGIGRYYARVAGINEAAQVGGWSNTVGVEVKEAGLLAAPMLQSPSDKSGIKFKKIIPDVEFEWEQQKDAKEYEFQVARDPAFVNLEAQEKTATPNSKLQLEDGSYHWRVRSVDGLGRPGTWSVARSLDVKQNLKLPQLIYPERGAVLDYDAQEDLIVPFAWKLHQPLHNSRIIISDAADFSTTVSEESAASEQLDVKFRDDGTYYWRVEGEDPDEHVMIRSEARSFVIAKNQVQSMRERHRIEVQYRPGYFNFRQSSDVLDDLSVNQMFYMTASAAARFWFRPRLAIDGAVYYRTFAHTLDTSVINEEILALQIGQLDYAGMLIYRSRFFEQNYPLTLDGRFGYRSINSMTLFQEGSGSISLRDVVGHNAALGVGASIPLGGTANLESKLDYLKILRSTPIVANSGLQFEFESKIVHDLSEYMILSYGLYYNSYAYSFTDQEHQVNGDVNISIYGILLSLGLTL